MKKTLSSPNRMVCSYFEALRRLSYRTEHEENIIHKHQDTSLCVILSVTGVEAFLNLYFRVLISETPYKHAEEQILSDLQNKVNLDIKIKNWPHLVFNEKIDFGSGVGQKFTTVKNMRNKLIHFSSSHETIEVPGVIINGMADTSAYDSLKTMKPIEILEIAENFICEIFRLRGIEKDNICHMLHSWTGKVPEINELTKSST